VASGRLKLLCPDKRCEDEDIEIDMKVAVEGRQKVNALLSSISPEEFDRDKKIKFSLS
jgi:predicted ATP-dependent Lon-type protease